jgi:hypothetical protein
MRSFRLASAAAVIAIVLAGCGSSTGTGSASTPAPGSTDSSDGAASTVAAPAAAGGSCTIAITGGKTVSFTSNEDSSTLQMDYWLPSDARTALALSDNDEGFLMNCQGGDLGSVSFLTTDGTTAAAFPKGPATYQIRAQLGTVGDPAPGQVQTLINLKDKNVWGATEVGTFTITDLTGSHFAGSFSVKIGTTGSNPISANVSGSFDLSCQYGACS